MPVKKNTSKRKYNYKRLAVVALAGILAVSGLGILTVKGYRSAKSSKEPEQIVLDSGEVAKKEDISKLRQKIVDVIDLKYLSHLKDDIKTYIFNNQLQDLKTSINNYLSENNIDASKVSYAVQDLTTGAYIKSDNAADNNLAASTYKLPLTMLWYEKIANGEVSPTQEFEFTENMLEKEDEENPNQPIGAKYKVGDKIPLSNLLEAAALYSDNIAGHILFENLGGYSAFKHMATKYSEHQQSKDFFNENKLNPDYTMDLVRHLYETSGTYDDLKYWLTYAGPHMFLNYNNPHGYVQKVGNNEEIRNVIGYAPTLYPFSVCIYSQIGDKEGEKLIGDIGDICWAYFEQKYNNGDYEMYDSSLAESRMAIGSPQVALAYLPDLPVDQRSTLEHPHGKTNSSSSSSNSSNTTPSSNTAPAPAQDQNSQQSSDSSSQAPAADPNAQPASDPNAQAASDPNAQAAPPAPDSSADPSADPNAASGTQ